MSRKNFDPEVLQLVRFPVFRDPRITALETASAACPMGDETELLRHKVVTALVGGPQALSLMLSEARHFKPKRAAKAVHDLVKRLDEAERVMKVIMPTPAPVRVMAFS